MKTLDEVIGMAERCTLPYPGDCLNCEYFEDDSGNDCRCKILADALHYLREYRETKKHLACLDDAEIRGDNTQVVNNPPLTWDELKQMEGKPVWVEEIGGKYATPYWAIHNGIMDGYDGDENLYLQPFDVLTKYTLGKTWNAYRKERSE